MRTRSRLRARLAGLRGAILLAVIAAGSSAPIARAASGSDVVAGALGYHWRDYADGAVTEQAGFDAGYTAISPPDDVLTSIPLPFAFPFYGVPCSTLTISDNGWLGLSGPYSSAHPRPASSIPDGAAPNGWIAPFWDQLLANDAAGGLRIRYGLAAGGQAFLIDAVELQSAVNSIILYRCYLYRSGLIRMQYNIPGGPLSGRTIGIENPAGTDGCWVTAGGLSSAGVPPIIPAAWVIEFEPPPILGAECGTFASIDCGSTTALTLPGPGPTYVGSYGCRSVGNDARERGVSFTLTEASTISLVATAGTARNLRMYLLASCSERDCISGPATSVTVNLGPGTYYAVVDAPTTADEGSYTIALTCSAIGTPTACGSTLSGTTAAGPRFFPAYACSGHPSLTGREACYEIDVPTTTNLRARLSGLAVDLDVLVLALGNHQITSSDCVAWGDDLATAFNAQGRYLIVVDGVSGASGAFTLDVQCGVESNCGSPAGRVDFAGGNLQSISGDTTAGSNGVSAYACAPGSNLDGPELVYEIRLPQPGSVVAVQTAGPGLVFLVLDSCNEGACVTGGCGTRLAAGTHYLVVDGEAGAAGAFDASLIFEPELNHWLACENAAPPTLVTDSASSSWHFDDGAFCYTTPTSHNYPDGCSFAMYTVVQCGTAMHIPLYDVESCNLRIFDVFRGEYVPLTAVSTGGWSMNGINIQWQDCGGNDPRWNNQTTDISFQDPNGLCGVFRLEFDNHSGYDWQLFANCTGSNVGEFNIHDSICGAFSEYSPLPSLRLLSASAVANCPDITVTYTLLNEGCGLARDIPVRLLGDGVEVATDILAEAPNGQAVSHTFSATFPGPTTSVTLVVDPDDVVLECDETGGVACEALTGDEVLPLPNCIAGGCRIQPAATATPPSICSGEGVTIDAGASTAVSCSGGALEYQLRDPGGIIAPWSGSAAFPAQFPTQAADFVVEVRCAALPACADAMPLRVDVERPPALDPLSVEAVDESSCNLGIRVAWDRATFFGPSGTGWYNVYRSTSSCSDALTGAPIASGLTTSSWSDSSTTVGTYFYVVEAEDATVATRCPVRGAVVGGPATRVDAIGGICQGVSDAASPRPDLLPRVRDTLRLGGFALPGGRRYGSGFVALDWAPDSPLDIAGGEHFHVVRSDTPVSVVSLLAIEPPRLTAPTFLDADAENGGDHHAWFYLVHVSDACENDNRGFDSP